MTPRVRQLLRQAKNVENMGKQAAAEKLFRSLVAEAPNEPEALLGLARLTRDADEQKATYERVIELDPKNDQAWAGLAGDWLEPAVEAPSEPEVEALPPAPIETTVDIPDVNADLAPPPAPVVEKMPAHEPHVHEPIADDDDDVVGLSCNKCGKPIDISTSVHTPVGYRCKECVRELEETYFTANTFDYVLAILVALPLSFIAGYLVPFVGFFVFFLAAGVGTLIGTLTLRAIGKRRGRYIPAVVAVCVAFGALAPMIMSLLLGLIFYGLEGFSFLRFINFWSAIYAFIATSAAYYRLRS